MLNESKPSGAKVTASFEERLGATRFWLTMLYVVILAAILIVSSAVTRGVFNEQLNNRFHGLRFDLERSELVPVPTAAEVRADLIQTLIVVNSILLIIAGIVSYLVAGATIKPIRAAYTAQKKFLSDASHELRTPLAILKTDFENELLVATDTDVKARLNSHLEEIERMRHLVADLLLLSKLDERGTAPRPVTTLNLADTVSSAVDRLKSLAANHHVTLHLTPTPNLIEVVANKDLLDVALSNIISNSIVYNQDHGSVDVTLGLENNQASITIIDTGIGIAAENLERIFDRFWRVEQSRSRATGGSGLGLAIVQSIMTDLGGSVTMNSTEGQGTTTMLKLPLKTT